MLAIVWFSVGTTTVLGVLTLVSVWGLYWKVGRVMATEQVLQGLLDAIKVSVTNVVTRLNTQAQTIADLQAQIAAGTPVTQDQLDALTAETQTIADGLAAALAPPATPAPVTTPPVVTPPVTPVGEPPVEPPSTPTS